ncbi:MAG: EAL domain-containing protein [Betaproteobacteria bacterium]|nr:EAL domain-containing protein [Betaproteobacteria bacterium]MDE2623024.1 EAL domain-containing protein [Betaproteobacteria bacterium]
MSPQAKGSKDKFRVFLEQAPDAFYAHDAQGNITDVNRSACQNLGYSQQELLALNVLDIEQDFDLPSAQVLWDQIKPGETLRFRGTHRRKDGSLFPVEVHATAQVHEGEKTVFSQVRDITDRLRTASQLERQTKFYEALSQINQAIVRMEEESELFPLVCRMAVEHGGMQLAWVGQARGNAIVPVASWGEGREKLDGFSVGLRPGDGGDCEMTAMAWKERRRVVVNDARNDADADRWQDSAKRLGWVSAGAFPVLRRGKTYAVLTLCHPQAEVFDATVTGLFDEVLGDIAFALDAFEREAERRRAMDTVKAQNDFLRAILEAEPECVKVVAPNGKLIHMNPAGLAMLEVDSVQEIQQCGLLNFIPPPYRNAFSEFHQSVCAGGSGSFEFPLIGKKGTHRWLETHATPLRNPKGEVTAMLGVTRDVTEKKHASELIWRQANFDQLTELPNRNMFYDLLNHEIRRAQRDDTLLAVLFIDLDRFKEVNDTLGHQMGDLLLMEAARRITSCVRKSDTVARLGGDEFTVILPQLRSTNHVEKVAQVIIDRLAEPFALAPSKGSAHVSASVGITLFPNDAADVELLISNADQAMYAAKGAGRNRFSFFTRSLQEKAQTKLKLINDLRTALRSNQFQMHFQPVVDLATGRIQKAESLLRWQHPERGTVHPAEFIPVAEETGLIVELGDWAFREASRWASRWAQQRPGFQVSVNMSPVQFRNQGSALGSWMDHLHTLGITGRNIVIEITESLLLEADQAVNHQLGGFRDARIEVAIDDFGTGYSSLSYINRFPIDYLKIDQSFVHDLTPGSQHHALSKAIIVMGHELGLKVIAEGIETDGQRSMLRLAGCDYGQGYLFSQPVAPDTFEAHVFG